MVAGECGHHRGQNRTKRVDSRGLEALGCIRVSTDEQAEAGYSLPEQRSREAWPNGSGSERLRPGAKSATSSRR